MRFTSTSSSWELFSRYRRSGKAVVVGWRTE